MGVRYRPSDPDGTAVDALQPSTYRLVLPAMFWTSALLLGIFAVVRLRASRSDG